MEDKEIVALYLARSENAINETASKYGKYCHTIAYHILSNAEDADESVNDTYMAAWNSIPPHRPSILSTFLGKITRRISIDNWRKRNAEKRGGGEVSLALDELSDCIPSKNSIEHEVQLVEVEKAVVDFLNTLPKIERWVFINRYWYVKSMLVICGQFGFSQSKVKSMLRRTRQKLKLHLLKEGVL